MFLPLSSHMRGGALNFGVFLSKEAPILFILSGWVFVIVPNWNAHFGNVTGTVIQVPTRRFVGFWFLVEDDER